MVLENDSRTLSILGISTCRDPDSFGLCGYECLWLIDSRYRIKIIVIVAGSALLSLLMNQEIKHCWRTSYTIDLRGFNA